MVIFLIFFKAIKHIINNLASHSPSHSEEKKKHVSK